MGKKPKIENFGEHIGGSRADQWKEKGLRLSDILDWTDIEREKYVKKNNVFPKPDYQKLYDEGLPREVVYFIKVARDSLPKEPTWTLSVKLSDYNQLIHDINNIITNIKASEREIKLCEDDSEKAKLTEKLEGMKAERDSLTKEKDSLTLAAKREAEEMYISCIGEIKDRLLRLKTPEECREFAYQVYQDIQNGTLAHGATMDKFYKKADLRDSYSYHRFCHDMEKNQFLYSEDEKIFSQYNIYQYKGDSVKIGEPSKTDSVVEMLHKVESLLRSSNTEDNLITVKEGGSIHYMWHNEQRFMNRDVWKENTYFVVPKKENKVVEINFPSRAEAEKYILEYEQTRATMNKTEDDKPEKKVRKTPLRPPYLSHICREGENYREGKNATGKDMMETFGFRAGEFGNWESQKDRQTNLNMSFDAFKDLAKALGIQDADIALGDQLALAFGARGGGKALAHFETDRNVINLTKLRGAGSLAHEFGHALDFFVAREFEITSHYASQCAYQKGTPMENVVNAMKYTTVDGVRHQTDFYRNAKKLDDLHSSAGKGYWRSDVEMFARAFSCYVMDKLAPERCDYLCGHSEICSFDPITDKPIYAYPTGEERKRINAEFDKLMENLKEKGIFHQREEQLETKPTIKEDKVFDEIVKKKKGTDKQETKVQESPEQTKNKEQGTPEQDGAEQLSFEMSEEQEMPQNGTPFEEPADSKNQKTEGETVKPKEEPSEPKDAIDNMITLLENLQKDIELAKKLQIGDVILLEPRQMMDLKTSFRTITSDREYAVVTKVTDDEIRFNTYSSSDLKDKIGIESFLSTENKPWGSSLAANGFTAISVKALEPEKDVQAEEKHFVACQNITFDFTEHPDYAKVNGFAEDAAMRDEGDSEDIINLTDSYMRNVIGIPKAIVVDVPTGCSQDEIVKAIQEKYSVPVLVTGDEKFTDATQKQIMLQTVSDNVSKMMDKGDFQKFLELRSNIGNYSMNNTALIYGQMPTATAVKSAEAWEKQGYTVKEEELDKQLAIWSPVVESSSSGKAVVTGYQFRNVLDVSQTEQMELKSQHDRDESLVKKAVSTITHTPSKSDENLYLGIVKYATTKVQKESMSAHTKPGSYPVTGKSYEMAIDVATYLIAKSAGLECENKTVEHMAELCNSDVTPEKAMNGRQKMFQQAFDYGTSIAKEFDKQLEQLLSEQDKQQHSTEQTTKGWNTMVERALHKCAIKYIDRNEDGSRIADVIVRNPKTVEAFSQRVEDSEAVMERYNEKGTISVRISHDGASIGGQSVSLTASERSAVERATQRERISASRAYGRE